MKKKITAQSDTASFSRRHFLRIAGITTAAISAGFTQPGSSGVSVVADPADKIAQTPSVQWAVAELEKELKKQGIPVQHCTQIAAAKPGNTCIIAAGPHSTVAASALKIADIALFQVPEALALVPVRIQNRPALLATGTDERGLLYALLELADRVKFSRSPLTAIHLTRSMVEKPANRVRSVNRLFVSDIEDKPWFNDREMWPEYLSLLATQRFNRFNLSFGIGYDFLKSVTDAYFLFAYPFFLAVPGYDVRVAGLPDTERDHNLAMLKFISEQTVARGMDFQLGLWMHGYEWQNSPDANYTITGLTKETHAVYCRDAVRMLLKACPAISGITFRVHGESGVNEGSYDFWKTIFQGVATCGRTVAIDMHSKGIDQSMLDTALSVNLPLTVSPKFWAEHLGMPYHQADIRQLEIPKPDKKTSGLMALSDGSRSFMRYGYGDLLKEDRKFDVVHRIWPGTQRLLLWGDPVTAAAQSRSFSFCGSAGVELMEPLSFKGRRGSGIAGDRCGYADASLTPHWDWQKYEYSLRVFGRTLYNPEASPDVWQRYLQQQLGPGAAGMEQALSHATRILPTVLTAHGASAGNNIYWPEMYSNLPIANAAIKNGYSDTPAPRVFGMVSPLDPQLFLGINEFVKELLSGNRSGKYTPIEVAKWIEDHARTAATQLALAEKNATGKAKPGYRRMVIDITLQIGLGRFFAEKFRAGALFAVYEQTGDRSSLEESLKAYHRAREHWSALANSVKDIYKKDVTAGELPFLRGHWLDRLPAIDEDLAAVAARLDSTAPGTGLRSAATVTAVNECLGQPLRPAADCVHHPEGKFKPGASVSVHLTFGKMPLSATLYYRHVNQGERYQTVEMTATGKACQATIPGAYTDSPFPLAYYFEIKTAPSAATLYPGLGTGLKDQPYFVMSGKA